MMNYVFLGGNFFEEKVSEFASRTSPEPLSKTFLIKIKT